MGILGSKIDYIYTRVDTLLFLLLENQKLRFAKDIDPSFNGTGESLCPVINHIGDAHSFCDLITVGITLVSPR